MRKPRSLISTFVICSLDSMIPVLSISEISSLYLASVACRPVVFYLVANPEDRFSRDEAQLYTGRSNSSGCTYVPNSDPQDENFCPYLKTTKYL